MKPLASVKPRKICRRCNKNSSEDLICAGCKNELIALYDNKLSWRTAYEVEKVSRRALLYTRDSSDEDLY
jgi:transposase-like protein